MKIIKSAILIIDIIYQNTSKIMINKCQYS